MNFLKIFLILLIASFANCDLNSPDISRSQRQNLVRKHLKHLKKEEGAIRLVGGQSDNEGNIEIFHNGRWGNICDDEWDKPEANVVCRQLGFKEGKATHSGTFGNARRKYWMDNLYCNGKEKEISDCRFDGWGNNDCDYTEAAGVICEVEKNEKVPLKTTKKPKSTKISYKSRAPMEVRLVGGRVPEEGRVEVRFGENGEFGDVCADEWSLIEANVVCKQLNLGYANQAYQTDYFGGSNGTNVILSGTQCVGNETNLSDCKFDGFGQYAKCHSSNQRHVAGVSCVDKMADLIIDSSELETTAHLEDRPLYFLTCAMEENCVASQAYEIQKENQNWHIETRRLLKFTAKVLNGGTDDFRPHIPKNLWEFHLCHMHYHSMEVFATFDIINEKGVKVAEGHKASFCLEDNLCKEGIEPRYACANYGDQGISVGCYDIYKYNIDCQWIDITEIEFGEYTFKVSINPEHKVPEMTYENNAATCNLLYTQQFAKVYNCTIGRP
ncbi:hypothetical protein PVAND_015706 [Polypedilum vanderplanki]|uniref:SRCR domain-containing protein n=1 Tax=Polypedilum vanderplanki TaxID=319348 RepID=A0A9J6BDR8_POLVA|nr:hypothetical protein PVAND_015706 [Polypedilum vanderplanki]